MKISFALLSLAGLFAPAFDPPDGNDALFGQEANLGPPAGCLPGEVLAFGQDAFVVASVGKKKSRRAMIAAAEPGKGRVVAFGHGAFLSGWESSGFITDALQWTGRQDLEALSVLVLSGNSGLESALDKKTSKLERQTSPPSASQLTNVDVLVWEGGDFELSVVDDIEKFVRGGGGLLFGVCPWGRQQIWEGQGRGKSIREDLPFNQLANRFGLAFGQATAGGGDYVFDPVVNSSLHAGRAVERVLAALANEAAEPSEGDPGRVAALLRALPRKDDRFRPAIVKALAKADLGEHVPSEERVIRSGDAIGFIGMLLASSTWNEAAAEDVPAAPGSEFFPGAVPDEAPRTNLEVEFSSEQVEAGGWLSTGYYAVAGEPLHLRVTGGDAAKWSLRIGAHKDELWHKESWSRWPQVTLERPVSQLEFEGDTYRVTSAFGGLVYLVPRKDAKAAAFRLEGGVEAPFFELGNAASMEDWERRRRAPAPWGELACEGVILTVPSGALRNLDNPTELMTWWNTAMACYPELRGEPQPLRPERLVEDIQISAGWMHSGYPVMTHGAEKTEQSGAVDFETLSTEGNWGYFHEFGHNAQKSDWTFSGTGEVTCNLFSLYLGERMAGIEPWKNNWLESQKDKPAKYFAKGSNFEEWKKSPGLALMMYAELQREFGWGPFKKALRSYLELAESERPRTDLEKHDRWLLAISRAAGKNLGPYFEKWGMPTTAEARAQVTEFESWMPASY